MRSFNKPLSLALTLMLAMPVMAQERTAAGALDTQMTWSTLKSLVDDANTKSGAAHIRIDQIVLCNKNNLIYAPGVDGADSDGCIVNSDITHIIECGKLGKTYNGAACVGTSPTNTHPYHDMVGRLDTQLFVHSALYGDVGWPHL